MPTAQIRKRLKTSCAGCGTCCTDTIVPVNGRDIKKLMKASGKTAGDIVRLYDSTEIGYDKDAGGWIRFKNGRRIIGLKQQNDRCMFLDSDDRCRVYGARPSTCRLFPLQVEYDNAGITDILYIKGVNCERTSGKTTDKTALLTLARAEDRDDEAFNRIIRRWNRAGTAGGKNEFLAYAGLT